MRRDNASNYLTELIACARRVKAKGRVPGRFMLADLDLADLDALRFSRFTDVERNASLRAAFEAFGLDPNDPDNWRLLLALFAEAYFVPRRPRGGKRVWDAGRLCQLLADFAAVKDKQENRGRPKGEIYVLVKRAFPKRYGKISAATIRDRLQDARNPDKNSVLGAVLGARPADPRGMTAEQKRAYAIELISKGVGNRIE